MKYLNKIGSWIAVGLMIFTAVSVIAPRSASAAISDYSFQFTSKAHDSIELTRIVGSGKSYTLNLMGSSPGGLSGVWFKTGDQTFYDAMDLAGSGSGNVAYLHLDSKGVFKGLVVGFSPDGASPLSSGWPSGNPADFSRKVNNIIEAGTTPTTTAPTPPAAPKEIKWLDHSTISVDGVIYYDDHIDHEREYKLTTAPTNGCLQKDFYIDGFTGSDVYNPNTASHAKLHTKFTNTSPSSSDTSHCYDLPKPYDITISAISEYNAYFIWQSKSQIATSDGKTIFTQASSTDPFINEENTCQSKLETTLGSSVGKLTIGQATSNINRSGVNRIVGLEANNKSWPGSPSPGNDDIAGARVTSSSTDKCAYTKSLAVYIGQRDNSKLDSPTGSSTNTSNGTPQLECSVTANPLSWFICPLLKAATEGIASLDKQINSNMYIPISGASSNFDSKYSESGKATYSAWSTMRSMSLSLLVIIALVMVISQAIGSGPFDAYTVKKVLPRIVIAVIGVSLSWQICRFMIGISNDLGQGVGELLYKPFSNLPAAKINGLGSTGLGAGVVALFFGGWDILVVLSLALTGFAAVLVAFMVIAFRNILAILLVIFAPAALILWILPNTSKAWKTWRESFEGVLFSFPIIIAFITAGKIFAVISTGSGKGLYTDIITFLAYFGPYFALPAAFRLAGGAVSSIGGIVNDRSKGFFDRQKKFRGEKKKAAVHRRQAGNTFQGATEGSARERMNNRVQKAFYAGKATRGGALLKPSRWGSNIESAIGSAELEHGLEESEKLPGAKGFFASDDLMNAGLEGGGDFTKTMAILASKGWTAEQAKLGANQALGLRHDMGATAFNLAAVAKLPGTGTAFVGEKIGDWHKSVAKYSHGNKSVQASIVAAGKSGFRNAQRYEVSEAAFSTHMQAIRMAEQGKDTREITNTVVDSAYESGGAGAVVGIRNAEAANMMAEAALRDLKNAAIESNTTGDRTAVIRALARVANIQDQMAGGKKVVTDALADKLLGAELVPGSGRTVLQEVNNVRNLAEFQEIRRELGREGADMSPELRAAGITASTPATPGASPTAGGPGAGVTPPGSAPF